MVQPESTDAEQPDPQVQVEFVQRKIASLFSLAADSPGSGVSNVQSGPLGQFPALVTMDLDPIGPIEIEIRKRVV